jgi:hypothetical protein
MLYFAGSEQLPGILVKVGAVLAVTWLAMPQLESLSGRLSTIAFLVVLLVLVVAAAKPNFFKVVAGVAAVAMALNWVLKWASVLTKPPGRQ